MARREEAVNLIREFPSNLMFKLLIILKERQRQKFSWKTLLGCWRGKTSLGGRKSSIKVIYFVVVSAPVFKRICSCKEDEETEAQKLLSRILARLQNSKRFEIFQLLLLRVNILCDMVNRLQKTSSLVNILSISRFIWNFFPLSTSHRWRSAAQKLCPRLRRHVDIKALKTRIWQFFFFLNMRSDKEAKKLWLRRTVFFLSFELLVSGGSCTFTFLPKINRLNKKN